MLPRLCVLVPLALRDAELNGCNRIIAFVAKQYAGPNAAVRRCLSSSLHFLVLHTEHFGRLALTILLTSWSSVSLSAHSLPLDQRQGDKTMTRTYWGNVRLAAVKSARWKADQCTVVVALRLYQGAHAGCSSSKLTG